MKPVHVVLVLILLGAAAVGSSIWTQQSFEKQMGQLEARLPPPPGTPTTPGAVPGGAPGGRGPGGMGGGPGGPGGGRFGGGQQQARWEYKLVPLSELGFEPGADPEAAVKGLDKLGGEGWELVAVNAANGPKAEPAAKDKGAAAAGVAVFKRRVAPPPRKAKDV